VTATIAGGSRRRRTAALLAARALGASGSFAAAVGAVCVAQAKAARGAPKLDCEPPPSDGLHGSPTQPALRVLWVGDSLAAGVGVAHRHQLPAAQLAAVLGRPCAVTSRAVPGATVGDVVASQLPGVDVGAFDLAIVQVGANDVTALTGRHTFAERYRAVLDALTLPTVCIGLPDIATADRLAPPLRTIAGMRARMLDAVAHREAIAAGAVWVDIHSRPPELTMRMARALLSEDRFHPGPEGYRLWVARIAAAVHVLAGTPESAAA
jgi:lysophospholipase L1-like esterase